MTARRARAGAALLVHADAIDLPRYVTRGSVALAYLDPPFAVGTTFRARAVGGGTRRVAYDDRWPSLEAYLAWLGARLEAIFPLVKDDGTLWLHLDQRAVHEAKILADRLFGRRAFAGEIIWLPGNGSKARRGPGVTHQTILIYARSPRFLWNARDPALRGPFADTSLAMHFTGEDADGRRYRERTIGKKTYRYYADEGRALGSVWSDCPAMAANTPLRKESTGYPTQKPLKLLERIVRAASLPGDVVLDPFFGSGTTLEAAARLGRRAVGSDVGDVARKTAARRLEAAGIAFEIAYDPKR